MVEPYWTSDNGETTLVVYQGHVLDVLREMPAESVHMVVTSPPYWGLRDYKLESQVWGGDAECEHEWWPDDQPLAALAEGRASGLCRFCGAWKGSLGLEPTPNLYVQHLVEILREVRRVLRRDGTLWLNMGDAYSTHPPVSGQEPQRISGATAIVAREAAIGRNRAEKMGGLPEKNLLGMPWRVVFALQADGWWLRSDIIWSKPNPMPESVTDRPTKAHEYLFLLAKDEHYYYDAAAISEKSVGEWNSAKAWSARESLTAPELAMGADRELMRTRGFGTYHPDEVRNDRNKRTVWEIPTEPYPEAHFATYPQKLVEPCILAGASERGCCPECGAPWERITETERTFESGSGRSGRMPSGKNGPMLQGGGETLDIRRGQTLVVTTVAWRPTCAHGKESVPCTVLDPFVGSGTTLLVAQRLGRNGIGIDLSEDYCRLAVKRFAPEHGQMRLPVR